jgi:hypothetical protein
MFICSFCAVSCLLFRIAGFCRVTHKTGTRLAWLGRQGQAQGGRGEPDFIESRTNLQRDPRLRSPQLPVTSMARRPPGSAFILPRGMSSRSTALPIGLMIR